MSISRREFVQNSVVGGAALVTIGGASGCGNNVAAAPLVEVPDKLMIVTMPTPTSINVASTKSIVDPDTGKRLADVGTAVTLDLAPLNHRKLLVAHVASQQYVVTDSACPHAGCPLGYSSDDKLIECPCHGSRFRAIADPMVMGSCVGQVTHLPAASGLNAYSVAVANNGNGDDMLSIDLSSSACNSLPQVVAGKLTLPLSQFPALAMVGGSLTGNAMGLADKLIVVRVDQTTVTTLSAICTHLGCTVGYEMAAKDIACPCHGSHFDLSGMLTQKPVGNLPPLVPGPLKTYPTTFDGATVIVTVA